jgi:UDPglucose 6-dehydrogenase
MRIAIIGMGYVGLPTGIGFAINGNKVICVDRGEEKVKKINKGISPIYEPEIEDYLKKALNKGLEATTDLKYAISNSDVSFICVGTPSKEDGSINLRDIENVSENIAEVLKDKYHVVVVKSTVVPGSTEKIIEILERVSGKKVGKDFGVCMNPEFLREGKAMEDILNPDRIVIGEYDSKSGDVLEKLYANFNAPVLRTNLKTAEMIKYASNSLLAAKISFANEIGNICKRLDIDVYDIMKGVALDHRISPHFLRAGIGWGGSCFKKDISAIIAYARKIGYEPEFLQEILNINKRQRLVIIKLLKAKIGDLKNKRISILGLAFKPGTDDIRDAPSIDIIKKLIQNDCTISAYDPKAMPNMKKIFPNLNYCKTSREALKDSDGCLILTEWDEFKKLRNRDFDVMRNKVIIEGRKVLNPKYVKNFEGVCW